VEIKNIFLNDYSYFKASAGLATAALNDWVITITKERIKTIPADIKNTHSSNCILKVKLPSHLFIKYAASGHAIKFANITNFVNSLESIKTILLTEAPIVLRILSSLVLNSILKDTNLAIVLSILN